MQARFFSDYSLALFQMAFQVKFLASRGENSEEMFMQGTSTAFSYQFDADTYHVDATDMESYDTGVIDDKLTEIFATACLKGSSFQQERTATGANFILDHGNEFIIRDLHKMCLNSKGKNYISPDPRLTSKIFELLQNAYPEGFPSNFPKVDFSYNDGKSQLRVTGTKEQIILFTDALIAIANKKEIAPDVQAESVSRPGI